MKLISKKSVGVKPVYDIGLAQFHNFLVEGDLVSSNCFNRSHSLAYSWLAWQCAYLKVYYPLQFMAALLTINSGKSEKLAQYLKLTQASGIKVLPPDINRSAKSFTTTPDGEILFGLRGLSGLGDSAIASILSARNTPFASLADFCERVNINTDCVEALIKTGAFDSIVPNRHAAFNTLPKIQQWAANKRKSQVSGDQLTLFAADAFSTPAPAFVERQEYSRLELLEFEKEILGVYLSGHPLDGLPKGDRIASLKLYQKTKLSVQVTEHYAKESQKGVFANLEIEDKWGDRIKAVCWADEYLKYSYALEKGAFIHLEGKVTEWNGRLQVAVNKVAQN